MKLSGYPTAAPIYFQSNFDLGSHPEAAEVVAMPWAEQAARGYVDSRILASNKANFFDIHVQFIRACRQVDYEYNGQTSVVASAHFVFLRLQNQTRKCLTRLCREVGIKHPKRCELQVMAKDIAIAAERAALSRG